MTQIFVPDHIWPAIAERDTEITRLKTTLREAEDEMCQILGKALGYPWYKDDQQNFPGATEENGVCVGEHVAGSIAMQAAAEIVSLRELVQALQKIKLRQEEDIERLEEAAKETLIDQIIEEFNTD